MASRTSCDHSRQQDVCPKRRAHDEPEINVDLDTLPEPKSVRDTDKSMEVMVLDEIVQDIMNSDEQVVVTYSDDGSKKQGAGSLSVQSTGPCRP